MSRFRLGLALCCCVVPVVAGAQGEPSPRIDPRYAAPSWRLEAIGSDWEERARLRQLLGSDATSGFLLRSTSSRLPAWPAGPRVQALPFVVDSRVNTETPFGPNSGTMSQMPGTNLRLQWGLRAQIGPLRILAAPEVVSATNQAWQPLNPAWWFPPAQELAGFRPEVPPTNASPWTAPGFTRTPFFIDTPMQFGSGLSQKLTAGQTAVWLERGAVAAGYGAESHWWGPGQRNALLLSNNAPSFPAAFIRTTRPLQFGWGTVEARYLLGRLTDSRFFRLADTATRRSLSGAVVVVQPRAVPGLELGMARTVIKQLDLGEPYTRRWADVLQPIGRPNARPLTDFSANPQRDQLSSLFFRYVAPSDGFEVYGEFGRAEEPVNLRDLLIEPNHSQAVTLGMQWVRPIGGRLLRLQWERSFLEQSPTYLNRPMGSWYTSRVVPAGFTNEGRVLGAAIGQGSSGQWVAADLLGKDWRLGAFFGRHRFNADAFFTLPWPAGTGYCEFDTSFYPGLRGGHATLGGLFSWEATYLLRLNTQNQNDSGCPSPRGVVAHDRKGWSFAFRWSPAPAGNVAEPARVTSRDGVVESVRALRTAGNALAADRTAMVGGAAETFAQSEREQYLRILQTLGKVPAYPWSARRFTAFETERLLPTSGDHPWAARYDWRRWRDRPALSVVRPSVSGRWNSTYPLGDSDGAVWAGRGMTLSTQGGVAWRNDRVAVTVAPVLFGTQNAGFAVLPSPIPNNPWLNDAVGNLIDLPQRFGDRGYGRFDLGQTSAEVSALGLTVSAGTANDSWGPGQRYAPILSANAAGIPGIRFGTAAPVSLGLIKIHGRFLWGQANESGFFTAPPREPEPFNGFYYRPRRFISSFVGVVQPAGLEELELGVIRFTHAPWPDGGLSTRYFTRPFGNPIKTLVGNRNGVAGGDQFFDGDNQIASVFARWVLPKSGLEVYAEYGKEDYLWDWRYIGVSPDEQTAQLWGLRKAFERRDGRVVVFRAEALNYQQKNVDRARGGSAWYLHSSGSPQGHTQFGQLLGAPLSAGRGAGAEAAFDVYSQRGRTTVSWRRDVQRQSGSTGPNGTRNAQGTEARHLLTAERLWFRGKFDVLVGATAALSFNRFLRAADQGGASVYTTVTVALP